MRILQLINVDGQDAGLYITERTDSLEEIQEIVESCFDLAHEAAVNDHIDEEECSLQEFADKLLEYEHIHRVYADEVTTEVI